MLALLACLPAAAFQLDAPALPNHVRLNGGSAIQELDGETWALGPHYKARLTGGALEFVPALGQSAPRAMPLGLRTLELGRGEDSIAALRRGVTRREQARIERPIAVGVTEQLEATEAGLELSYLFESRPAGDGDLVVRLALDTELPLVQAGPTGLEFSLPGIGGVTIGAVTGIDALGARQTGDLRVVEEAGQRVLELSLPDQFVDQAQFPLLLDPIIGTAFDVNSTGTAFAPDAIWSQASLSFFVCWKASYGSGGVNDILVRRFDANGNPLSPVTLIYSDATATIGSPQIAAFDGSDRVLIGWNQTKNGIGEALARSFRTNLSNFSNVITIQSVGLNTVIGADVAGRRDPSADGMAIWSVRTGLKVTCRSRRISVPMNGDPTLGVVFQLEAGDDNSYVAPRLAHFADIQGRFFAGWADFFSNIRLARLSSSGAPVQPFSVIEPPEFAFEISVGNSMDLDQNTSGTEFLLSYSYYGDDVDDRFYATTLTWSDTPGPSGNFAIKQVLGTSALSPNNKNRDVGTALLLGQSAFLAMNTRQTSPVFRDQPRFARFNKDTGSLVSVFQAPVDTAASDLPNVSAIAARPFAGGTDQDTMLYVYTYNTDMYVQLAEQFGTGLVASLGGNCGSSNFMSLTGTPVVGHPGLSVGMDAATPGTLAAVLNIAYNPTPIFCGACAWNPFQTTLVTPVQGTTVIPLNLPVPLNAPWIGQSLEFQWTLVGGPNSPCALSPGIEVSNRLRLTFGE
jgi:hypothetical protein